jgi:hypothetical protein
VRALLGELLENLKIASETINKLKESLNPFTIIEVGLIDKDLTTNKNWNME